MTDQSQTEQPTAESKPIVSEETAKVSTNIDTRWPFLAESKK